MDFLSTIEIEETVTTCKPPENGAGPFWCYGSPLIVRLGDEVFISAMETGENIPPLCNTRWRLFRKRNIDDWEMIQVSANFNEREPCPLVCFPDEKVFLSVNPSSQPPGTKYGNCDPHLIEFTINNSSLKMKPIHPIWDKGIFFTDHSYRGIAADGIRKEILLLNINAQTSEQFWSLYENGNWTNYGRISFPIRSCYPQVALKNHSAHVLAIGDIVEPVDEWRNYKFEKTGSGWDYVFRRLFYAWTPDITKSDFSEPIEVDDLEKTAGHITNLDLWIDDNGKAHILYLKRNVQSNFMRDKFFPDVPINISLEYVIITKGKIENRVTLIKGGENSSTEITGYARFHVTKNGNLFVIYYCNDKDSNGNTISENRLMQILPKLAEKPQKLNFREPFGTFFTAIERSGTLPSDTIDIFGSGSGNSLRYARIGLKPVE